VWENSNESVGAKGDATVCVIATKFRQLLDMWPLAFVTVSSGFATALLWELRSEGGS